MIKEVIDQGVSTDQTKIIDIRAAAEAMRQAEEKEYGATAETLQPANENSLSAGLARAKELFPRVVFPWDVLPPALAESFKQMAESLGILPDPVPSIALASFASAFGRKVVIRGKGDHSTLMIIWYFDVRDMGGGKTATLENLISPIKELQANSDRNFKLELEAWNRLSAEEQKTTPRPSRARGYWAGSYTQEGVRSELVNHPTGGLLLALDEGSKIISSQNAYRGGRGSDREDLCTMHNGDAGRTLRADEVFSQQPCNVCIIGGIQSPTLRRVGGSEKGLYLGDGTITRILMTYNPPFHMDISYKNVWSAHNRAAWRDLIKRAFDYVDEINDEISMTLTDEAADHFYDVWRNEKNRQSKEYIKVPLIDGFLMKTITYALRFSGLLACLKAVHDKKPIPLTIGIDQIKDAIKLAEYYMGHAVDIATLLLDETASEKQPEIVTEETVKLGHVLNSLKNNVVKGLVPIGLISEKYNQLFPSNQSSEVMSSKKIGTMIGMLGLKKTSSRQRVNGGNPAYCLEWGSNTDSFIKSMCSKNMSFQASNNTSKNLASTQNHTEPSGYDDEFIIADYSRGGVR